MKLKHTPGPWIKDYGSTDGHIKSVSDENKFETPTICRYKNYSGQTSHFFCADSLSPEECEANARLIATAPEMLDCLIQILKNPSGYPFNFCSYAEKCVEKATGMPIDEVLE